MTNSRHLKLPSLASLQLPDINQSQTASWSQNPHYTHGHVRRLSGHDQEHLAKFSLDVGNSKMGQAEVGYHNSNTQNCYRPPSPSFSQYSQYSRPQSTTSSSNINYDHTAEWERPRPSPSTPLIPYARYSRKTSTPGIRRGSLPQSPSPPFANTDLNPPVLDSPSNESYKNTRYQAQYIHRPTTTVPSHSSHAQRNSFYSQSNQQYPHVFSRRSQTPPPM